MNSFCLLDTNSFSKTPDFLSPTLINVLHSFGIFTNLGLITMILKPIFTSKEQISFTNSISRTIL